ncbi:MAG: type II secretion system protein [Phycisphaeraceae bacterium]
MHRQRGFTFTEMLALTACLAVIIAIALAMLPRQRRVTRNISSKPQITGIVQGCILYAQGNGEHYPGLDLDGKITDASVEGRMKILLDGNYFTPEYAVSPSEQDPAIQKWLGSGPFTANHHSYAILQISTTGARRTEWAATVNKLAAVASDRNTGSDASAGARSIHHTGKWIGHVVYNDMHFEFNKRHVLRKTQYGSVINQNDNLFDAAGADDAYMIHSGQ